MKKKRRYKKKKVFLKIWILVFIISTFVLIFYLSQSGRNEKEEQILREYIAQEENKGKK